MVQILIPAGPQYPQGDRPDPQNDIFMIELQGSIETDDPNGLKGAKIGNLEFKPHPTLTIGHHKLDGKLVQLSKPLVLIRRNRKLSIDTPFLSSTQHQVIPDTPPPSSSLKQSELNSDTLSSDLGYSQDVMNEEETSQYKLVTVIRYKYVFRNRPELVLSEENQGLTSIRAQ